LLTHLLILVLFELLLQLLVPVQGATHLSQTTRLLVFQPEFWLPHLLILVLFELLLQLLVPVQGAAHLSQAALL
jgi:hypothetical protein